MPPKIPQLHRENASLRQETHDPQYTVQEACTGQKIPQDYSNFVSAKKVWWDDQKADPQLHIEEKAEHDAVRQ